MLPYASAEALRCGLPKKQSQLGTPSLVRPEAVIPLFGSGHQNGLTLRAVFRLALRQTEGLIGSILRLLGIDLAIPDHSTLSGRAETLEVPIP
jgi:hypothetical protein